MTRRYMRYDRPAPVDNFPALASPIHRSRFTGPNGKTLASYTPDIGNAYTVEGGALYQLQNNRLVNPFTATSRAWTETSEYDVWIRAKLHTAATGGGGDGVVLRNNLTDMLYITAQNGSNWTLYTNTGGSLVAAVIGGGAGISPIKDTTYQLDILIEGAVLTIWAGVVGQPSYKLFTYSPLAVALTGTLHGWRIVSNTINGAWVDDFEVYRRADVGMTTIYYFCDGDSITRGTGDTNVPASPYNGYPLRVGKFLNFASGKVYVEAPARVAVSGRNLATCRANVDAELAALVGPAPAHVFWNFGTNELLGNGATPTQAGWEADYDYCLEAAHVKWPAAVQWVFLPEVVSSATNYALRSPMRNTWIPNVVAARSSYARQGIDQALLLNYRGDNLAAETVDNIHPTPATYDLYGPAVEALLTL